MGDIVQFKVHRAEAKYDSTTGGLYLRFYYPRNPIEDKRRLGPQPEFGVATLEKLITEGHADIATQQNPISPPNAGSLPVTRDGKIICTRRDNGAPVHKMFHAAYSGFAQHIGELYSERGMRKLAARESAEEVLFITRDRDPYLIVTPSLREETLKSAKRMDLDHLPLREIQEEFLPGDDRLQVFYEDGEEIYSINTFFTMLWDVDASTIAMQIRRLDIHSEEILPIDAEGMIKDDKFIHFNRESFIVNPQKIAPLPLARTLDELNYAYPLPQVNVFQSYHDCKQRIVYKPHNSRLAYLGPGAVLVKTPYLWAPQDTLRACLDGLGIEGYKGKKLHWELEIDKAFAADPSRAENKVNESCIIPARLLA